MVEEKRGQGFSVTIDKSKLWGVFLFCSSVFIIALFVRLMLKVEEEMLYEYERLKIRRYGDKPRTAFEEKMGR